MERIGQCLECQKVNLGETDHWGDQGIGGQIMIGFWGGRPMYMGVADMVKLRDLITAVTASRAWRGQTKQ